MKIGIDFGTSFSMPAYYDPNTCQKVTLIPAGKYGIPSVFYYDGDDSPFIGEEAERLGQGENAKFLKREIKMDLGSTFDVAGECFTAREIVGYILKAVKDKAVEEAKKRLLGSSVEEVVISVPAAFTHNEKEFIRQAAEIPENCGGPELKVRGFIKEPVAAALAYFEESLADQTRILVYDLGGGTCDVAIVEADSTNSAKYRVVDAAMLRVGGKDWDERIRTYLEAELRAVVGDSVDQVGVAEKIKREANVVKHAFSENFGSGYRERVRAIIEINGGNHQIAMTRDKFNSLTEDLFAQTLQLTEDLIKAHAGISIDKIICVGGGSNMPQVQEGLRQAFPGIELTVYEPEKAIALGAAIYAHMEIGEELEDIAPFSYGTDCVDRTGSVDTLHIVNMIQKGDKLPAKGERCFYTMKPNASWMSFDIYESEDAVDSYPFQSGSKTPIMEVRLDLPPNTPKGAEVFCRVTLTPDGLLTVFADDGKGNVINTSKKLNF